MFWLGAIALSRTHFSCRAITDSLADAMSASYLGAQTEESAKSGGALSGVQRLPAGFAFALDGACIGPILAAVLALVLTRETISRGVFLLAVYSPPRGSFFADAIGIKPVCVFTSVSGPSAYGGSVERVLRCSSAADFLNRLTWLSGNWPF